MSKIKVSVIIPMYNVEKYVEECLESVINQTLKEIEIIIVNDGSTDNSLQKIEKYMYDPRIIVINKENGGLSSARNAGLKIAKGDYISFVDSDDFIDTSMLEKMYDPFKNSQVVVANVIRYKEGKYIKNERYKKRGNFEKGSYLWETGESVVWNKIYKRDFLLENNLKFLEGIIHEDDLFTLQCLFLAEKISFVNEYFYYYREQREGSIMTALNMKKRIESFDKIVKELVNFKIENKTEFENLRLYLSKLHYKAFLFNLKRKYQNKKCELAKEEILEFEKNIMKKWEEFTMEEQNILRDDIKALLEFKVFYKINIFNGFYWKNKLINKKNFRRIIENKIKNIINRSVGRDKNE